MKQDLIIRIEHTNEHIATFGKEGKYYSYRLGERTLNTSKKLMNQDAKHLFDIQN